MTLDSADVFEVKRCRICEGTQFHRFLDLGVMPLPNGFISKEHLGRAEAQFPLRAMVCERCSLMQLSHVVSAEKMFRNYLYIPSTSHTMLEHFERLCRDLIARFSLEVPRDMVIDVGSNDGSLLDTFRQKGFRVLGIDPASNLATLSQMKGIETITEVFSCALATRLHEESVRPSVVIASNVVAHIDDLNDFCRGVTVLLDDRGVLVMEFPYALDLIDNNQFDTIYHEHVSYFFVTPIVTLLRAHGLGVFDIVRTPVHGGSIRMFASKSRPESCDGFVANERARGIGEPALYDRFATRVRHNQHALIEQLATLRAAGNRIAGYGASAKANVLLNSCRIDTATIEYIVDSIPFKQWRYTPGTHIPIYPEAKLLEDRPEFALLMAWNFRDEIIGKQAAYVNGGGRFIVPIPEVAILGS